MGLDPEDRLDVISLHPPTRPLPVRRHWVLDPSVVPRRPARPVRTQGRKPPRPRSGSRGRMLDAAYRSWRAVAGRLPTVPALRFTARTQMAVACRSSRAVWRAAAGADVLVALDNSAVYGAWLLAQRFPHLTAVARPTKVEAVLRAQTDLPN